MILQHSNVLVSGFVHRQREKNNMSKVVHRITANLETITFDKILHIQGNTIIIELFGHFDLHNHETVAK